MTNDEPRLRLSSLHMPSRHSPNWSSLFRSVSMGERSHPNMFYVYAPWTPHRRRLNLPSRLLKLNFQPTLSFVGRQRSRFLRGSRQKPANAAPGTSSFPRYTIPSMVSLSPTWRQVNIPSSYYL